MPIVSPLPRLLALSALAAASAAAQRAAPAPGPAQLPFGAPTAVRVVADTAAIRWRLQRPDYRLAPPDTLPPPPLGSPDAPLDGTIGGPVDGDSLQLVAWVAGDAARTSALGRTWVATIPWHAVRRVERRVDNTPVIERVAWRRGIATAVVGALVGGVASRRSPAGGAALGGALLGWGGWVTAAQGASTWAPACWRLAWERDAAAARRAAGATPWLAREGEPVCDTVRR